MSTKQNEINDKNLLITSIKLENDTDDDDLIYDKSSKLNNNKKYYHTNLSSTSTIVTPSLTSTYKGKIEVTSKGRRKIFDGVRWQILCRRPECRKQTNKKSLCITHYKEEYESNTRPSSTSSSSSWSTNLQSFQLPSYHQQHSFDSTKTRNEIEDQNNTITTTNITDNDEQISLNSNNNNNQLQHDDQIEYMHNGRRFVLKNNKWQSLCKYDNTCRNVAKYEYLCIKHYELTQQKRRDTFKFHNNNSNNNNNNRRSNSSIFDNHRSIISNNLSKRVKSNDFQILSSSVTEQFNINSNENNYISTEVVNNNFSLLASKISGHDIATSSRSNRNILSSDYLLFDKQKIKYKNDQSVQTDLTIPLCCIIQQEDHSFYSICKNKNHNKSTSSILSYDTKSEPQSFDTNFSTSN